MAQSYKRITAEKKLEAVYYSHIHSVKPTAKEWGTLLASIRYWRKQERELARLVGETNSSYKSSGEAGRKLAHPDLEMILPPGDLVEEE